MRYLKELQIFVEFYGNKEIIDLLIIKSILYDTLENAFWNR